MKLITTGDDLSKCLSGLLQKYPKVEFAVAWASAKTEPFTYLTRNPDKIKRAVIGTHFYQTHPDVLEAFADIQTVRFIKQPDGVFHPKIYLFSNGHEWEALIGSANLTAGALNANSEVMILFSHLDTSASPLDAELKSVIDKYWSEAKPSTKDSARAYRNIWITMQPALSRLSGHYGKTKTRKPPTESSVMSMNWDQYLETLRKSDTNQLNERSLLLRRVRDAFLSNSHFSSMALGMRQTIAGMRNKHDEHWGWFGSMKGAGYFNQAVNSNNQHLSLALDEIPLQGQVSESQFNNFLSEFKKAFSKGGHGVATGSRLLALKRPDQFICLDSKNRTELCRNFGISSGRVDYERYWNEIVNRIVDSPWWNSSRPKDETESLIWEGRAAMLDVFFYRP